jgi:hypothetical protein
MLKVNFPDQWAKANSESVPTPVVEKAPAAKAAPKKAKK